MDQGLKGKERRKGEDQGVGGGGRGKGRGGEGGDVKRGKFQFTVRKWRRRSGGGGEEGGISRAKSVWSRGNQKPHDNLTEKIEKKLQ